MIHTYLQVTTVFVFAIFETSTAFADRFCDREQFCVSRNGADDFRRRQFLDREIEAFGTNENEFRCYRAERRNQVRSRDNLSRHLSQIIVDRQTRDEAEFEKSRNSIYSNDLTRLQSRREREMTDNYSGDRRIEFNDDRDRDLSQQSRRNLRLEDSSRLFLRRSLNRNDKFHDRIDSMHKFILERSRSSEYRNPAVLANVRSRLTNRRTDKQSYERRLYDLTKFERNDKRGIYGSFNTRREKISRMNERREKTINRNSLEVRNIKAEQAYDPIHRLLRSEMTNRLQNQRERISTNMGNPTLVANIRNIVESRNVPTNSRRQMTEDLQVRGVELYRRDISRELNTVRRNNILNRNAQIAMDRQRELRQERERFDGDINKRYRDFSRESDIHESRINLHRINNKERIDETSRRSVEQNDDIRNNERFRQFENNYRIESRRRDSQDIRRQGRALQSQIIDLRRNVIQTYFTERNGRNRYVSSRNDRFSQSERVSRQRNRQETALLHKQDDIQIQKTNDRLTRKLIDSRRDNAIQFDTEINRNINEKYQRRISRENQRQDRFRQNVRTEDLMEDLSSLKQTSFSIQILQAALMGFWLLKTISHQDSVNKKLRYTSIMDNLRWLSFGKVY